MDKLRVIIRTEKNYDSDGFHWIAVFPDDKANPGRVSFLPFDVKNGKVCWIEPFGEMALSYYYDCTKYVKPIVLDGYGVREALQKWYDDDPYTEPVELVFRSKLPDLAKTAWEWALVRKRGGIKI